MFDNKFLLALDNLPIKNQYIKLTLLSFDEKPLREIQGVATSGSLNISNSSSVRRTMNLSMFATEQNNDLEDIDNMISIDKKIKIEIGYDNPFDEFKEYGEIVWFNGGTYIISSAALSSSVGGCSISISGQDKMVMLNGVVGGTLPATVVFHEIYETDNEGNIYVTYPTISQIIREAVNHYGKESINKIFINDLEDTVKLLIKYNGDNPIYFSNNYSSFIISNSEPSQEFQYHKFIKGEDIGYEETDFTYPGELIFAAGSTITNLLDKICDVLGNYEYFYDLDGNFVFQEIKNYLNTRYTPFQKSYIKAFSDSKYFYNFSNSKEVTAYSLNPQYNNIKNDFIVWGERTTESGIKTNIRYHLAIDNKPILDLCKQNIYKIIDVDTQLIIRYDTSNAVAAGEEAILVAIPADEWREELYRQALLRTQHSVGDVYYDAELIAEWRKLYDPMNEDWAAQDGERQNWNPDVFDNPEMLDYWLDFIDTDDLSKYSVNKIGRRSIVKNDTNINHLFSKAIPDIIFIKNEGNIEELEQKLAHLTMQGQQYCLYKYNQSKYFIPSGTWSSAYDAIREMLHNNLLYNTSITISCLPKYYFDVNQLIYVNDKANGVYGNYVIQSISLPLSYNGTMSINAIQAIVKI